MKTTKILVLVCIAFIFGAITKLQAQATKANTTNTVVAADYLGSGSTSNVDVLFKRNAFSAGRLATNFTTFGVNTPLTGLPSSVLIGVSAGQYSGGSGFNTYIGQNAGKGQSASVLNTGINNTFIGFSAGRLNGTGSNNFFAGAYAGEVNTTGNSNYFAGAYAGNSNTTGTSNYFSGAFAGYSNSVTNNNYFSGYEAGKMHTDGNENTFIGNGSGSENTSSFYNVFVGTGTGAFSQGSSNVYLGRMTGTYNISGQNNTFIGTQAGSESAGSNNVYIGRNAGFDSTDDSKLIIDYIDDSEIGTGLQPLIWGDFAADQLKFNGKVGIGGNGAAGFGNYPTLAGGVNVSAYKLFVKGGILTEEVRVSTTWADYVFNKDYNLKPLSEVETYIKDNGHLPNVPSACQVKEEGIELGNMAKIQQEKIEELTLYIIALNKKLDAQQKQIDALLQNK